MVLFFLAGGLNFLTCWALLTTIFRLETVAQVAIGVAELLDFTAWWNELVGLILPKAFLVCTRKRILEELLEI